jgi:methylated-DNA-[protein]-cysteine S-methyltransferase
MYYTKFKTNLCIVTLLGDENGLSNIYLQDINLDNSHKKNDEFFKDTVLQLQEYFTGNRKTFNVKLNPKGTDFQKKVWKLLEGIDYAKICSYQDIATKLGNKNACRAVGMANSKNPIPIIVPCHRVIGKNGKLTGFASGLQLKQQLINLENTNNI